jgi:hypothetical protein
MQTKKKKKREKNTHPGGGFEKRKRCEGHWEKAKSTNIAAAHSFQNVLLS